MTRFIIAAALLSGFLVSSPVRAGDTGLGMISPSEARRYGLEIAWYTHAKIDRSRGRIVNIFQHVSSTKTFTAYEVRYGGRRLIFSEKDVDVAGKPIDPLKEAEKKARELERTGVKSEIEKVIVPEITLYVVNDRGGVQSIDAETGKSHWNTSIGDPAYPTLEVAANDKYVASINGSTLYVLDATTGKLSWDRKVVRVPGAGPAIATNLVHVPTTTGMLESFFLAEPRKPPAVFQSFGRALVQPTISTKSVAWTTDRGHMYVAHADKRGVKFRIVASDTVNTRPIHYPPASIFMTSVDGYAYHVHEGTGDIFWRFSAGKPISKEPFVMADSVYVIADRGGLYSIRFDSGQEQWWVPGIKRFIGATKDRLYCVNELGRILILDRHSGARLGVLSNEAFDVEFVNQQTDRILLANKQGVLQCLREISARWPTIHYGMEEAPKAAENGDKPAKPAKPGAEPAAPAADPFGNEKPGADPFGAPAADPFGGDNKPAADPFGGGGGAKPADDPFGAPPAAGGMQGGAKPPPPADDDPFK